MFDPLNNSLLMPISSLLFDALNILLLNPMSSQETT